MCVNDNSMNRSVYALIAAVVMLLGAGSHAAQVEAPPSPYEVAWDSPSKDSNGTMPLGNGEVAVNAWIEPSGDLRFYVARTDSWDDSARLVKVGSVRIKVGTESADRTKAFRQVLTVKDGTLSARYGEGDAQVDLKLWVDANRPVICVEAKTIKPSAATATIELWRNSQLELQTKECSDVLNHLPEKTVIEPDTVLSGIKDRIGWYHRNIKSVGPATCAKIQGVADFPRADPLLHRTFGALIATERPERVDDKTLRSATGTSHVFEIAVCAKHPATAEEWQALTQKTLDEARALPLAQRRSDHERWWSDFWNRSWINITQNGRPVKTVEVANFPPTNRLPVRIGMDQKGGSKFAGEFGRVGIYSAVLAEADIKGLAGTAPTDKAAGNPAKLHSAVPGAPQELPALAGEDFAGGFTLEAWIKPSGNGGEGRIVDKISVGGADGFLFDMQPGGALRVICGRSGSSKKGVLKAGEWQHVAVTVKSAGGVEVFLNGKSLENTGATATAMIGEGDDAFVVSRAYALQRFITACAGRGQYPIKYNGSILTVPVEGKPEDADYRRWGPGYWWQNTRLPYFAMPAAGDFEMMEPLFNMYARDLMPFFKFRTQKYLGHEGAYIPECIYFWGDMFTETYGTQPFEERTDKLQASGWHKWEWVSGPELVSLLLDKYEYTGDEKFLRSTVLPAAKELIGYFDKHYKAGDDGKLYMHPSQACETWWDCVNPMPELSGLHAATRRLLALPESLTTAEERAFWKQLQAKLPTLPTTQSPDGKLMLAPAQVFNKKSNCENPELYGVFPFRQIAVGRPNIEWGIEALKHRKDKGSSGWRQDDLFMTYLGLTEQARDYIVKRCRNKHAASRFPAFWGPNYDWLPDQCHGGVLSRTVQTLLLQTDGRKIYLLPAWPGDWNCEFKLHAPYQTVLEGRVVDGKVVDLKVTPEDRRKDVEVMAAK